MSPGAHVSLHPLEERKDGVGGRQPLVCGRLGQVVAHDPERVSQALQRDDGVLVSDVIADIDDPNPGNKSTSHQGFDSRNSQKHFSWKN